MLKLIPKEQFKKQAQILKEFLNKKDATITISTCYLAIAKMNGFKDWNTMSAWLKENENGS